MPVAGDMARDTPTGKEDKTGAAHGTGERRRGKAGKRECSGVFGEVESWTRDRGKR